MATLNLDGWATFVGSSDDISKIINMRLCLTLAYREFLRTKMTPQHSVIKYLILLLKMYYDFEWFLFEFVLDF